MENDVAFKAEFFYPAPDNIVFSVYERVTALNALLSGSFCSLHLYRPSFKRMLITN